FAVLDMQKVLQPGLQARHSIPNERPEIVAHRMQELRASRGSYCTANIADRRIDALALAPDAHLGLVMISPSFVRLCLPQWGRRFSRFDNYLRVELVIRKHAFPLRHLAQDEDQVGEIGFDLAVRVKDQGVSPVRLLSAPTPQFRFSRLLQLGE